MDLPAVLDQPAAARSTLINTEPSARRSRASSSCRSSSTACRPSAPRCSNFAATVLRGGVGPGAAEPGHHRHACCSFRPSSMATRYARRRPVRQHAATDARSRRHRRHRDDGIGAVAGDQTRRDTAHVQHRLRQPGGEAVDEPLRLDTRLCAVQPDLHRRGAEPGTVERRRTAGRLRQGVHLLRPPSRSARGLDRDDLRARHGHLRHTTRQGRVHRSDDAGHPHGRAVDAARRARPVRPAPLDHRRAAPARPVHRRRQRLSPAAPWPASRSGWSASACSCSCCARSTPTATRVRRS